MADGRQQLLNDQEQAMRLILDGRQVGIWTSLPGIIQSFDASTMTCTVQPAIQAIVVNEDGTENFVNLPLLVDCPVVFPSGGGFLITFPLEQGDECVVNFSSRCIDAWWQLGGVQQAMEARMHDLSDGFVIPGPWSQPNVPPGVNTSKLQIRSKDGTVFLGVGSKFSLTNPATSLITVLTDLQSAVNSFMEVLAAFSGGGAPVTQVMLQVPAAAAVGSLTSVLAQINELLEAS
jgi:Phage protein Gp138 N-terminal domain